MNKTYLSLSGSQLVAIAEVMAQALSGAAPGWQTGRVWSGHGHIRVYAVRGAREMGWLSIDADGAVNCAELRDADKVAPVLEAAVAKLIAGDDLAPILRNCVALLADMQVYGY